MTCAYRLKRIERSGKYPDRSIIAEFETNSLYLVSRALLLKSSYLLTQSLKLINQLGLGLLLIIRPTSRLAVQGHQLK